MKVATIHHPLLLWVGYLGCVMCTSLSVSEVAMAIPCLFKRSNTKWYLWIPCTLYYCSLRTARLLNLGEIPRNTARPGRSSFAKLVDRAGRLPPRACFPTLPPPSPKRAGEQDETVHGHRPFNLRCTTNLPWVHDFFLFFLLLFFENLRYGAPSLVHALSLVIFYMATCSWRGTDDHS